MVSSSPPSSLLIALETVYNDVQKQLLGVAIDNYMGGQKTEFILHRFRKGLEKLNEAHALLAKEIKGNHD